MVGKPQAGRDSELIALGHAIRRHRNDVGFSVVELSLASGVSRRMIQGIELGARNPSVRVLIEIAAALGVRASDLIREAEVDPTGQ